MGLTLHFPFLAKFGTIRFTRTIYINGYRSIIQLDSECARYDPELTYTLKPGICHFRNLEFNTIYKINSAGLRDEESSLSKPDIIVLGDSLAMGWGVHQNETYSKIIESKLNLKVLNAAVASYGTYREMRLLNRLDTSNLKYLIIHYMTNDYEENKEFYEHNNVLKISSEKEYNNVQKIYIKSKNYYLGKYTILSLKYFLGALKLKTRNKIMQFFDAKFLTYYYGDSVKYFINAVMAVSRVDLRGIAIVIVSNDDKFIARLKDEIKYGEYPNYIKKIIAIPVASKFTLDSYFILDDHLTAKGHEIIANEIIKTINLRPKK
jgi:hypothetical protein